MATVSTQHPRRSTARSRRQEILRRFPSPVARALLDPWQALLRVLAFILLLAGGFVVSIPFFWMLSTALKPDTQVYSWPPIWIPSPPQWRNFSIAVQYAPFPRYALNTAIITFFNVIGALISSSLVAFGFARLRFPGRGILFGIVLTTMMLPGLVTLIPLFVIFSRLKWVNTWLPLIVPGFFGNPFFIFLLRQFFLSLPPDYHDQAKIDGAGSWTVFWRIYLPLSAPSLATVVIFQFMGSWSDYLGPFLYLHDDRLKTISVGLSVFLAQYTAQWQLLMAASILMILPMLLLFFFAQKYFIQGITTTGLAGR
jgi:multiple sugar transport system permease protein